MSVDIVLRLSKLDGFDESIYDARDLRGCDGVLRIRRAIKGLGELFAWTEIQ